MNQYKVKVCIPAYIDERFLQEIFESAVLHGDVDNISVDKELGQFASLIDCKSNL